MNLDCRVVHLDYNGEKLAAAKRTYGPGVIVHDPGLLGAVLLTSEMDGVSAQDIVKEFDIELWDDYYERAMAHRRSNMAPR